jgi:hypothetical protein
MKNDSYAFLMKKGYPKTRLLYRELREEDDIPKAT